MSIFRTALKRRQYFLFIFSLIETTICPTKAARLVRSETRIVGGENVTPTNRYPMIVALATTEGDLIGAGTIWNKYFILTSAEVANMVDVQNTRVLAGIYHFGDPDYRYLQNMSIERKLTHERHLAPNIGSWANNIAIIELMTALVWNDYVAPTNVPEPGWNVLPTIEMTAQTVGWGRGRNRTVFPGSPKRPLQQATVPLITTGQCQRIWSPVVDDHLCIKAGPIAGTCNKDQGGPLFIYNEENEKSIQVGIASQVAGDCEDAGNTAGYLHTKVSKYLQWVEEVVRNCYDRKTA